MSKSRNRWGCFALNSLETCVEIFFKCNESLITICIAKASYCNGTDSVTLGLTEKKGTDLWIESTCFGADVLFTTVATVWNVASLCSSSVEKKKREKLKYRKVSLSAISKVYIPQKTTTRRNKQPKNRNLSKNPQQNGFKIKIAEPEFSFQISSRINNQCLSRQFLFLLAHGGSSPKKVLSCPDTQGGTLW